MNWKINISILVFSVVLFRIFFAREESKENNVLASIRESGYEGEVHHAITEDGYVLGLQRIINGPNTQLHNQNNIKSEDKSVLRRKRPPVLFVHGLESSAIDWICYNGQNSLPYLLYEEGFDVWLGNVRGTLSSFNHTKLHPVEDASKFWNSSIDEIGYYDIPAMIDCVLRTSGREKLFYIGMSQGEASFLMLTSTRPEYNAKIQLAFLTSPSSHLNHSDNVVMKSLGKVWPIFEMARKIGWNQMSGRDTFGFVCQYDFFPRICNFLVNWSLGYSNPNQMIPTKFFQVYPTKSALKQFVHYLQLYNSGKFRRFDYGKLENLQRYATAEPPEYDLTKVSAPVAYYWGENDCWSRPKDIANIEKKLPNLVLSYKVQDKFFNHCDVMSSRDAKDLVYMALIDNILKYTV